MESAACEVISRCLNRIMFQELDETCKLFANIKILDLVHSLPLLGRLRVTHKEFDLCMTIIEHILRREILFPATENSTFTLVMRYDV